MQTLIVEADTAIQDILKLNLEAFAGTDVIARGTSAEVTQILSIIPTVQLIVMRSTIGNDQVASQICQFLKERELDIPCIIVGNFNQELYPNSVLIKEDESWEAIVDSAFRLLGVSNEPVEQRPKPKFIPIDIRFFFEISEPPCDVYVRIRQNAEDFEYQYIKLIHSQDAFDHALIEKYEYQGLTDFYIEEDYHQYFVTCVTNNLLSKLKRRDLTQDQRIISNDNAYRVIMSKIDGLGIDEEAVKLAHVTIDSMVSSISQSDKLSELINRLFSNKISYAYQKAHLTFIISTSILNKIAGHTQDDLKVMRLASFFADINLKSQRQLNILNYQNFMTSELTLAEKSVVEFHARQISKMVEENGLFPEALVQVLKEHHGSKDGVGFPKNFPRTLHYLSYLYIAADYFVCTLLHPRKPSSKAEIVEIISQELNSKQFKPYLEALKGKLY